MTKRLAAQDDLYPADGGFSARARSARNEQLQTIGRAVRCPIRDAFPSESSGTAKWRGAAAGIEMPLRAVSSA
jgi:hypothetical protein